MLCKQYQIVLNSYKMIVLPGKRKKDKKDPA